MDETLLTNSYLPLALKPGVAALRAAQFAASRAASRLLEGGIELAKNDVLPPRRKNTDLRIVGNVGIIDVKGVLDKDLSWFSWFMGDSTYESIQDQLREALVRDEVTKVLLLCDTPGGNVNGIDETRQLIKAVNKKKPVFAHASGLVCSAGYALASAARKISITEMTEAGSIGVVLTHIDQSAYDKERGIKVTEITAGEFKRMGSAHKPLDKAAMEYLQALVDKHMSVFKAWVQEARGFTEDQLNAVANGALFIGSDALDLGLVDRIATYDDVLSSMLDKEDNNINLSQGVIFMEPNKNEVTLAWINENCPQLAEELRKEGETRVNMNTTVEQAVKAERERIKEVLELAPTGLEATAQDLAFTSPVSAAQAAVTFLKAAKEKGTQLLNDHRKDAPPALNTVSTDTDPQADEDKAILAATAAFNAKRGIKNPWDPTN